MGKINLLPAKLEFNSEKQRQKLKHLPSTPYLPPRLNLPPSFPTSLSPPLPSYIGGCLIHNSSTLLLLPLNNAFPPLLYGSFPWPPVIQKKRVPAWSLYGPKFLQEILITLAWGLPWAAAWIPICSIMLSPRAAKEAQLQQLEQLLPLLLFSPWCPQHCFLHFFCSRYLAFSALL